MATKLVIFDCDGVLVDTEPLTDVALSKKLTSYGLPIAPDEVLHLFRGGTIQAVGEEAMRRGARLPDNWLDDLYAAIFDALRRDVPVINGVSDLIDALDAAGIARAIASNGPIAKMEISLTPSGLWDRFAGRIYSGHEHGPKPQPDMLLRIMTDAGVTPAETVMIDDTPAGFEAARAAGMRCFGYVADGDPARVNGTDAIPVTTFEQIAQALDLR